MRRVAWTAALVVLWLLAWGDVSVANVVSGIVVSSAVLVFFPLGPPGDLRFHPVGAARLVGYVAVQLVVSNVAMVRQIVRPRPAFAPGVIAHHLQQPSEGVLTAMTSVISLSPGTMTVDTTPDASTIYVHFLVLDDIEVARQGLRHLEELVVHALGGPPPATDPPPAAASAPKAAP
ncbi:MAG TPA: Na+/H+ antiporter subunit E [Acidimicrobiales bacterium]|nr:Na+/H+ antiporter subunit E [Acidimicrobiales bacterium]